MTTEEKLRTFIQRGYRPTVRSHAFRFDADLVDRGYEVLSGIRDLWSERDAEPGEVIPTGQECVGWVVDAKDATGNERQTIIGGTFATVDAALDYSLRELDKYAPEPNGA